MKFDFLTNFSLPADKTSIDQVRQGQGDFISLQNASWTTKAQVLATGIGVNGDDFDSLVRDGQKSNGRKNLSFIGGHPELVKSASPGLSDTWQKLLQPSLSSISFMPEGSWLITAELELRRPFYSQDDRPFYPVDNPLKRDWVFHTPYLPPSSIKGLLRWAWRMLYQDTSRGVEELLFGSLADDINEEHARHGSLYFWPLFWNPCQTGLEVLNPQDRIKGAGLNPVKYEVVKPGARAKLYLLFFNRSNDSAKKPEVLSKLIDALAFLLQESGLAAKRSVDWGSVQVNQWRALFMPEGATEVPVIVEDSSSGANEERPVEDTVPVSVTASSFADWRDRLFRLGMVEICDE